jgi:adenosine deaminase
MTEDLQKFVRGLPKAELHVHIEGTLEPDMMFELASRNGIALPYSNVQAVRDAYAFSNLQDFLNIYYAGANVLQTALDFEDLAMAYFRRLHADGGVHAEIFFDPQTHTQRGLSMALVVDGLLSGMQEAERVFGITSILIPCFLRHLSEDEAIETFHQAEPHLARFMAVGLDSSEVGHPPSKFKRVFALARQHGLKTVAHAGEEGPADYVREALDELQVDRIDHGNRALEDANLVQRLVQEEITLTVCPLSNLKLCVVSDLRQHPLRRMLDLGLRVTVNSDDPAYFGGYLLANYVEPARALGLEVQHMVALARNSFSGSFLSPGEIQRHLDSIDEYVRSAV